MYCVDILEPHVGSIAFVWIVFLWASCKRWFIIYRADSADLYIYYDLFMC